MSKSKFNTDLLWNAGSFGMAAVIGLLLNIIIVKFYDSSALGVFNQVYAIYILLSQVAVGGVHLSVQKFIPEYAHDIKKCNELLAPALTLSSITSALVIALSYMFSDLPGKILQSKDVSVGFTQVAWALLFFSFNKILMAYHNGLRHMKAFAVFQFLRFALMLSVLMFMVFNKTEAIYLPYILSIAEAALFLMLFVYTLKYYRLSISSKYSEWLKVHFNFGNRAFVGNFLMDVNTRVDVFLLGVFLSDKMVGVYSFAASFAEGFSQLPVLFRNNINPIIAKCYVDRDIKVLNKVLNQFKKRVFKILFAVGLLSIIVFPVILIVFSIEDDFYLIWAIYGILTLGFMLASGYLPFQMIFNQCGMPAVQTYFITFLFLSNVVFCSILIPVVGVLGAALGTFLSTFIQIYFQKYLAKKYLKLKF